MPVTPLYPFGYGLLVDTTFDYGGVRAFAGVGDDRRRVDRGPPCA
ncbi:hypothetical protein [Alistipes putredinis]